MSTRPLQALFDRLSLPAQLLLAGIGTSLLTAGVVHFVWEPGAAVVGAVAGGAALASAVSAAFAWRVARSTLQLAQAARSLARDDALLHGQLPYKSATAELHEATHALRRLLDHARQRLAAMQAMNTALGLNLQSRTQELSSLQDLSIGLAQQGDIGTLVGEALNALQATVDYSSASVWARVGLQPLQPVVLLGYRSTEQAIAGMGLSDLTGLRLSRANLQRYEQIEEDRQPLIENHPRQGLLNWLWAMVTDDARTSALYRSTKAWMAVPLQVRQRVLGVLRVDHGEAGHFDEARVRLLTAVASQTALALRHAQLSAQERDLAIMGERNRIARELHDAVSQTLFAANLLAGTLARSAGLDEASRGQVAMLEKLNRSALAEMRMLMFELRPDALAGARLSDLLHQAVEALAGRTEMQVSTALQADNGPPLAQRLQLYRIAQTALSNIARHSAAHHVLVGWAVHQPGHGRLTITDDGCGFDPQAERPGHFGVANMRQRAAELGAELSITSAPGNGTAIQLDLDWDPS